MPVHELRYRAWEGSTLPVLVRLLSVPRYTLTAVFNKYIAAVLLGVGVMQLLGYTGYLVIATMPQLRELIDIGEEVLRLQNDQIFRRFYAVQYYICLILVLLAAPKMLSPELAHRSIAIIFSRAIPRSGYILGKVAALGSLLSLLTWVQTTVLWFLMYALYDPASSFHENFWQDSFPLLWKSLLFGMLMTGIFTLVGLAGSAITKSPKYATIIILMAFLGPGIASTMIDNLFDVTLRAWAVRDLMQDFGFILFDRGELLRDNGPVWILTVVFIWLLISFAVVFRQLRPDKVYRE